MSFCADWGFAPNPIKGLASFKILFSFSWNFSFEKFKNKEDFKGRQSFNGAWGSAPNKREEMY
jgi:hypothetical protein